MLSVHLVLRGYKGVASCLGAAAGRLDAAAAAGACPQCSRERRGTISIALLPSSTPHLCTKRVCREDAEICGGNLRHACAYVDGPQCLV